MDKERQELVSKVFFNHSGQENEMKEVKVYGGVCKNFVVKVKKNIAKNALIVYICLLIIVNNV